MPCVFHGDGVPFKKAQPNGTMNMNQWGSLVGYGSSTYDTQWLYYNLPNGAIADLYKDGFDTLEPIWVIKTWDFAAMLHGFYTEKYPWGNDWPLGSDRANLAGTALTTEGYFGALVLYRSDVDYMVKVRL